MKVTPRSMLLRSITASVMIVLPLLIVMPGSTGTPASAAARPLQHPARTLPARTLQQFADSFVTRSGPRLGVAGRPFRFGGANIEWLGLPGYGPFDPRGPHFPSNYEIDDAMETAREMGVNVVRSQTMGDSVMRSLHRAHVGALQPGRFRTYRLRTQVRARTRHQDHPTIVGDDARAGGTGCVYLRWRGISARIAL